MESPLALTSVSNLVLTNNNRGRWDEAEELKALMMEISIKVLGAEHPHTLTSMNNLCL
jgi:hypothetical protein